MEDEALGATIYTYPTVLRGGDQIQHLSELNMRPFLTTAWTWKLLPSPVWTVVTTGTGLAREAIL